MTKDLVIIALGIWVAVLPFLGFPNSWDRIFLVITGLSISVLMFLLRRDFFAYVERLRRRKRQTETYVENEVPSEGSAVPESEASVATRRRRVRTELPQEIAVNEYGEEKRARRTR